ncbi:paraquat-inducible protein A [Halarcobacter bivalviorum]|uniref:Paraquat-inducible protein A n=1 Tax=Halarcobacter bivalviorum TaxID=663364 RepID=A0AB33GGS0_9BACT|nr:paraquat-inducible protein A [Halarcobacter bivalviorum]AXH12655.1 paraquat-inducible protein A [Halarcobacter bivalviorum]
MSEELEKITICKDCGLVLNKPQLDYNHQFHCPRCNALIYKYGQDYLTVLLFAITSIILFIPAIFLPLLSLEILDLKQTTTLVETLLIFFKNGYTAVSILITFIGIIVPLCMLILIMSILIPLKLGKSAKYVSKPLKFYEHLLEWQMGEIYMISIVVAIIKLQKMATLDIGMGFYFFLCFLLMMSLTMALFNPYDVWNENEIQK